MFIYRHLKITRIRLFIAKLLYYLAHLMFRKDIRIIKRNGIYYKIDLREGIDLSLFYFGNFQQQISNPKNFKLEPDSIVFDIGANIGAITLQFAKKVPQGHVHAFEPTDYAFLKLEQNLELNEQLRQRITINKTFLSDEDKNIDEKYAYSSWKIKDKADGTHPIHGGEKMKIANAQMASIDSYCKINRIEKLDFIKIDTDGHEYKILNGGKETIGKLKPAIIFEIGLYLIAELGISFEQYINFFEKYNYTLYNSKNGHEITLSNYKKIVPVYSTIDILAYPMSK